MICSHPLYLPPPRPPHHSRGKHPSPKPADHILCPVTSTWAPAFWITCSLHSVSHNERLWNKSTYLSLNLMHGRWQLWFQTYIHFVNDGREKGSHLLVWQTNFLHETMAKSNGTPQRCPKLQGGGRRQGGPCHNWGIWTNHSIAVSCNLVWTV